LLRHSPVARQLFVLFFNRSANVRGARVRQNAGKLPPASQGKDDHGFAQHFRSPGQRIPLLPFFCHALPWDGQDHNAILDGKFRGGRLCFYFARPRFFFLLSFPLRLDRKRRGSLPPAINGLEHRRQVRDGSRTNSAPCWEGPTHCIAPPRGPQKILAATRTNIRSPCRLRVLVDRVCVVK